MGSYAVITLFYAVPEESAKCCDSRNGLLATELHGIIRRSQAVTLNFTLLITLLSAVEMTLASRRSTSPSGGGDWKAKEQGVQSAGSAASVVGGVHAEMEAADALLQADGLGVSVHEVKGDATARREHAGQVLRSCGCCEGGDSFIAPKWER